jgi:hypothetical protein
LKSINEKELLEYLIEIGKIRTGLQGKVVGSPTLPVEYQSSYNLNHPKLMKDQKLYVRDLCQTYSVRPLKSFKQSQYLDLLKQRKAIGKLYNNLV